MKHTYNFKERDAYWQKQWHKAGIFHADNNTKKKKYYALIEFPYPSGAGLHVGHPRPYIGMDIIARKRRAEGYNVLYPIGWDAFGLPTENYAIATGIHPRDVTKQNTETFKRQIKQLGTSFDWTREINTSDPDYYKWTQWIFLKMFEKGLAYKKIVPINWCPSCTIGLANEEAVHGMCERCGGVTEKREKEQWLLAITHYAERLLKGLDTVDYIEPVKVQQRNWIGRSEGSLITFEVVRSNAEINNKLHIKNSKNFVEVFTTRPDTLFGVTYLVLAPEHHLISKLKNQIANIKEVEEYIKSAQAKSDIERTAFGKEKTGVAVKGIRAVNPATKKEIPVFIADYVLFEYGTGAMMAVPAHDERDFEFAKKFNLPIVTVIIPESEGVRVKGCYAGEGVLINSNTFDGIVSKKAKELIMQYVGGSSTVTYKLRDWVFSRQRYWGEPIPLVFCENCAKKINNKDSQFTKAEFNEGELKNPGWVSVLEESLPVELPEVKNFKPIKTGVSPLAHLESWTSTTCPKCGGHAIRETDVMPNWAGSSWYFIAYSISEFLRAKAPISKQIQSKKVKQNISNWMPVDWYNGGMEHTTLHLLYSRFWNYFLFDIGVSPTEEPYTRRTSHGMILAEGGEKMSKSKGNVINPDDIVKKFGADTFRLYEMFMGPFDQAISWNSNDILGVKRFIDKCYELVDWYVKKGRQEKTHPDIKRVIHRTIKNVSDDIETMSFNTAISQLMICMNTLKKRVEVGHSSISKEDLGLFVKMLSPFAPHVAEELWYMLGYPPFVETESWPLADESCLMESEVTIIIQVNGTVRGKILAPSGTKEKEVLKIAQKNAAVAKRIQGKAITKLIFIENKLLSIVLK